jgi:hypothetical protein
VETLRILNITLAKIVQRNMTHTLVKRVIVDCREEGAEFLLPCCIAAGFSPETRNKMRCLFGLLKYTRSDVHFIYGAAEETYYLIG